LKPSGAATIACIFRVTAAQELDMQLVCDIWTSSLALHYVTISCSVALRLTGRGIPKASPKYDTAAHNKDAEVVAMLVAQAGQLEFCLDMHAQHQLSTVWDDL